MNERLEEIAVELINADQSLNITRDPFTLESLHEFSCSIRDNGQRTPVTVRAGPGGGYVLACGFRRLHAIAYILKWPTIKALVKELSDDQAVMENIIENLDRENPNPIEDARAFRRAFPGLSHEKIAIKLNKNVSWVGSRLRLLNLADDVQLMIANGRLKVSDAVRILQEATPEDQLRVAKTILRDREKQKGHRPKELKKGERLSRGEMEQLNTRLINAGLNWLAIRCISRCAGHISDTDISEDIARAIDEKKRKEKGGD